MDYETRTFSEIFTSATEFVTYLKNCGIDLLIKDETATTLYYLLVSNYGNSHSAYSDEDLFKLKTATQIFCYGPTWEKRLEIQANLRALSETDLLTGAKTIYDHAYNPSTIPEGPNEVDTEINTVNDQTRTRNKRSKLDAYGTLITLLNTDVTGEFLKRFRNLFLKVFGPPACICESEDDDNE